MSANPTARLLRQYYGLCPVDKAKEARDAGYPVIVGDATIDETLLQAGIEKARSLVSLLPKDSDNLYVVLTSRELSPSLFILSRTEDDFGEKRLRRAGANKTISPKNPANTIQLLGCVIISKIFKSNT